jgi:hypothetical protein
VLDAQLAQPPDPIVQLGTVGAAEADVVQAYPQLVEFLVRGPTIVLMDTNTVPPSSIQT